MNRCPFPIGLVLGTDAFDRTVYPVGRPGSAVSDIAKQHTTRQVSITQLNMNNGSGAAEDACTHRELPSISSVVLICLSTLSGLTAFIGNGLVVLAIHRATTLRIVSNYFIASLAVADLSVGLLMYPVLIGKVAANIWQGEHWLSKTADWLWMQTTTTTTFNLCAVSLDRYVAITCVFHYHRIVTKKKTLRAIAFIWVFSLVFASLRLLVTSPQHHSKLWIATTLLTVVLPLMVIAFCYHRIYKEAKSQSQKIAKNTFTREEAVLSAKNRKAAGTAAIIIGLFVAFWLPSLVASIVELIVEQPCQKAKVDYAWFWIAVLSFSSSAFNPWVYAVRLREFRNTIVRIVKLRRYVDRHSARRRSSDWESRDSRRFSTAIIKLHRAECLDMLELRLAQGSAEQSRPQRNPLCTETKSHCGPPGTSALGSPPQPSRSFRFLSCCPGETRI